MTIYVHIPDARLVRIVKCLSLLASDKPGERLAAADAAIRLLKQRGLTWEQIILPKHTPAPASDRFSRNHDNIKTQIAEILANLSTLNDWEQGFVHDVNGRSVFSEKQRAVIERLYRKTTAYSTKRGA
jgi:hypothetical protein